MTPRTHSEAGENDTPVGGAATPGEPGTTRLGPDPDATSRAFVVQLRPGAEPGDEAIAGRVQHLATCDGGNFASPEALIAIMRRVLERMRRDDDRED
jgi:hypothetical protein